MRDVYRTFVEYLLRKGIDPLWVTTIAAVLLLYSEKGNIKKWKSLSYNQRQWHGTLIFGFVFFIIIGILHLVFGLGKI